VKINLFERRSRRWVIMSIAAHIVIVFVLAQIMFRYPLGQLMGIAEREVTQEKLIYITVPQPPAENSAAGSRSPATPSSSAAPAALPTPSAIPTSVPDLVPLDSARAVSAGGTGTGFDVVSGSGLATGLVPRQPDDRIEVSTGPIIRTPRTMSEDVDSIVQLAIGIYTDSMAIVNAQRKPGDWVFKGKDGQTWGMDGQFIHVGKFKIPTALLALLPLNKAGGGSPIEARTAAYIRRDVLENGQRAISEDEFRDAVKRIRERKERERRQNKLASDNKAQTPTP
jgi:hypothetical protein